MVDSHSDVPSKPSTPEELRAERRRVRVQQRVEARAAQRQMAGAVVTSLPDGAALVKSGHGGDARENVGQVASKPLQHLLGPESDSPDVIAFWRLFDAIQRNGKFEEDWLRFAAYALPRAASASGQLLQDLWALWEHGEERPGYFVEFGACDGVSLSNTLLLERQFGWSGLVAEPNPQFHDALRRQRTCGVDTRCVWSTSKDHLRFHAVDQPEFSTLATVDPGDSHEREGRRSNFTAVQVETVTLTDLLDEAGSPGVIDYMSIDTEGSEFDILAPFDFNRYRVRLVSIEHNYTERRSQIHDLMISRGYRHRFQGLTRWDDWYVLAD